MPSFSAADIPDDWRALLGDYFESSGWQELQTNLRSELNQGADQVGPEPHNFFKALTLTPLANVKVVILGQDPYHSPGLAQGLAFSIPDNIPSSSRQFPSSLRNISKALAIEGFKALPHGDLHTWAEQGVLLLNTALSVKLGEAGSHVSLGWKPFIDRLISALALQKPHLVWMLWGGHAQSKLPLIKSGLDQLILQSSHPSGLGVYKTDRPFLQPGGRLSCGHFTKANAWLAKHQKAPVAWTISEAPNAPAAPQTTLFD